MNTFTTSVGLLKLPFHCSRSLRRSPLTIARKICASSCISSASSPAPVVPLQALGGWVRTRATSTSGDGRRTGVGRRALGVGLLASDSVVPIVALARVGRSYSMQK
jgi:hypothetical protein